MKVLKTEGRKDPKVLIGTPIHISKDYSMERWVQNVSKLLKKSPADLFIVDNSPGLDYIKKVKDYLTKSGIKNYKIKHIELSPEQEKYERLARSREIIRQELLSKDYDAWFSWENDQIIPTNALDKLVRLMKSANFMMVNHNCWMRGFLADYCSDFGVSLIARKTLEKYSFILKFGADPEMPNTWEPGEYWFKRQVLRDGGNNIEVDGVINPIYHLNE